VGVIK